MSRMGEAREVIAPHMDLLNEGRFRVDEPAGFQYPVDLLYATARVHDVLEHRLNDDRVERRIVERDIVRIANQCRERPERDVGANQLDRWRIPHQRWHPLAKDASAEHEHL